MSGEMIDVREGTGLCDVFNIDVLHIINDVYFTMFVQNE